MPRGGDARSEEGRRGARSAVAVALGPVVLAVAELAEDLGVGGVAALRRVERPLAVQAREARLVEGLFGATGEEGFHYFHLGGFHL